MGAPCRSAGRPRAHQLLHGDWPVRDLADPGQPLTYLLSATAAWLFGPTLRTDVIIAITLLSLAASLTYLLAVRASGSLFICGSGCRRRSRRLAAAVERRQGSDSARWRRARLTICRFALDSAAHRPAAWTAVACLWRHDSSCTPATSRVLVAGFAPEIPVLARRPFAGGFLRGSLGTTRPRDVERAATQLGRKTVSMAVMLEGSASFVEEWPRLAAVLRARGLVERVWRLDGTDVVVWVPEELAARAPSAPPTRGV
jgi:hypothetical protein